MWSLPSQATLRIDTGELSRSLSTFGVDGGNKDRILFVFCDLKKQDSKQLWFKPPQFNLI
jgi:hypothetical protein